VMTGGSDAELRGTRHTLVQVLESLLRLAHPIVPFITETIWQRVKVLKGIDADTLMLQPFPEFDAALDDTQSLADVEWIKQVIMAVRAIRTEMNISPGKPLDLLVRASTALTRQRINTNRGFIQTLARLQSLSLLDDGDKGPVSVVKLVEEGELLIPMAGLIDKAAELERLSNEVTKLEAEIGRIEAKLSNEGFVARAPEAVVTKEREKLAGYAASKATLLEQQVTIANL